MSGWPFLKKIQTICSWPLFQIFFLEIRPNWYQDPLTLPGVLANRDRFVTDHVFFVYFTILFLSSPILIFFFCVPYFMG